MIRSLLAALLFLSAASAVHAQSRPAPSYETLQTYERAPRIVRRAPHANLNHAGVVQTPLTIGAIQCPHEGTRYRVSVPQGACSYRHDEESRANYVSCTNGQGDRAWASCYQGCGAGQGQGRCLAQ